MRDAGSGASYARDFRAMPYFPLIVALGALIAPAAFGAEISRDRLPQDEVVYFLLPDRFENGDPSNDRGGLSGDRLRTGFDPASRGFYHGGDLQGVISRLDYIRALGATAVWLAPVFRNKPVQGAAGEESAGYHGYWVTDFTHVDPHFGTERDMQALVEAAHARGMKVYLDIITNHTADVIAYRECTGRSCPYRSRADYPQKAYTPYVPRGEEHVKVPEWLNDTRYYHNRGDSTFKGESALFGDFVGLDDLATEDPRVVQGFIEIYGAWIDKYRIDGYRIDTARHVNMEFWQAFIPAMLQRAAADGIPSFYIFGEVAAEGIDVAQLARFTRAGKFPAVLDFAFANAVRETVAGDAGTYVLARVFADDVLYEGGEQAARQLPTFISNHDMGRFAWFVHHDRPQASESEVSKRVVLAHAMLLTLRGAPVIYYGDEQGFSGTGGDKEARQDMFKPESSSFTHGSSSFTGESSGAAPPGAPSSSESGAGVKPRASATSFNETHPLFKTIAELSALRSSQTALRRGAQIVRNTSEKPGLFAVSRIDETTGREILIAFNTGTQPLKASVEVNASSKHFDSLHGKCMPDITSPGIYPVTLEPLDYIVCATGSTP
jgi:glycosidase